MSVTTAIQNATRAIEAIILGSPSEPEILDTLKQEHEIVAEMLKKLVESENGPARKNLLVKIRAALVPHILAEQVVLYDALIAVGNKKIKQDGHEGYAEHKLAVETLEKLEHIQDAASPEFGAEAKVLKELVEHHVSEEERDVWSDAKEKFSAEERITMNQKYLAAKKVAGVPKRQTAAAAKAGKTVASKTPKPKLTAAPEKTGSAVSRKTKVTAERPTSIDAVKPKRH